GSTIINNEIEKQIPKYMDVNMGEMNVSIENYQIYINIFEIESNWARGNKELLEFVILYDKEKHSDREMPKEIINLVRNFINNLKSNHTRYIAFYNKNSEELKENREIIIKEAQSLKKDLSEFYRKINKIDLLETTINKKNNFDHDNLMPIFAKIEKEIQKLLIEENSQMN
ncbi:MAG: hypothetical protein ACTSPA_12070, partial [Promethearchaeota archaeon]